MAAPELEGNEFGQLVDLVANLYYFTGSARDRRLLAEQANLRKFLAIVNWDGPARIVAALFVSQLNTHGFLVERPTYHALGALLTYLLATGELGVRDAEFLARLVVTHNLVHDPNYIEDLRAKYAIPDLPASGLVEPAVPFSAAPSMSRGPDFEPQIADSARLEKIINSEDNFLDIFTLLGAVYAAQAVARVELPAGNPKGTGFLIGPDLFLTNHHVIKNETQVSEVTLRFDYFVDAQDTRPEGRPFALVPGFYYYSPLEELDYALVKVKGEPLSSMKADPRAEDLSVITLARQGKHRGYLVAMPHFIGGNQRVNIVQHPGGKPLRAVLTQNYVSADMSESRVWYIADTEPGSSGSPVLNQAWEVVALHHASREGLPAWASNRGQGSAGSVNEGIPMRAILADLANNKKVEHLLPRPIPVKEASTTHGP